MLNNDENKDFNEDDDLRILFNRNSNEKIAEIRIANSFSKTYVVHIADKSKYFF